MSSSDSSLSSSFFSSSFSGSAAGPPPVVPPAPTAGAGPPPEPTFNNSSLTFLPSSAFASNDAHIGSRSTLAASARAMILSAYVFQTEEFVEIGTSEVVWMVGGNRTYSDFNAFISEDEGCVGSGQF